jgi:hypothetical protein
VSRCATVVSTLALAALVASCRSAGRRVAAPVVPQDSGKLVYGTRYGRLRSLGRAEVQAAEVTTRAEYLPDDQIRFPTNVDYDIDAWTRAYVEFLPYSRTDRDGDWTSSSTGENVFGIYRRLVDYGRGGPRGGGGGTSAIGLDAFAVFPHGGDKPPRWNGVIEGQEGYYGVLNYEIANSQRNINFAAGGGAGGIVGRPGKTGRVIGGIAWTEAFPGPGFEYSTDDVRLTVENSWVWDPPEDRLFGELGFVATVWVGSVELALGYRRGLTSETVDDVVFVGFGTRLFDAF